MQDKILLTVSVVTDDDTGVWEVGELEFGILGPCREYLKQEPENRDKLADWLLMLSEKCRSKESPFQE
jgi:hypothetical protein